MARPCGRLDRPRRSHRCRLCFNAEKSNGEGSGSNRRGTLRFFGNRTQIPFDLLSFDWIAKSLTSAKASDETTVAERTIAGGQVKEGDLTGPVSRSSRWNAQYRNHASLTLPSR